MVLLPTFHWTGPSLVSELPDGTVIVTYPGGPGLPLTPLAEGGGNEALAAVLGRTRFEMLLLLAQEHSTSHLAGASASATPPPPLRLPRCAAPG